MKLIMLIIGLIYSLFHVGSLNLFAILTQIFN